MEKKFVKNKENISVLFSGTGEDLENLKTKFSLGIKTHARDTFSHFLLAIKLINVIYTTFELLTDCDPRL